MISRPNCNCAQKLAAGGNWRELKQLVSDSIYRGDPAFTAAVDFIQGRPVETMAALRFAFEGAAPAAKQVIHWILAYAAARQGHSEALANALDDYLRWHPRRSRLHLMRTPGFVEAEIALRAAIAERDLDSLWNDLGVLQFSFGYIEEALSLFANCLARDPAHRYATINYAVALLTGGMAREAQEFVARTSFCADLPVHLLRIVRAVQASAGDQAVPKPKDCWYWYRRCIYSYAWRSRLPQLFEQQAEVDHSVSPS